MKTFWQEALSQAVGGLIIAAVGGVGYLCWSVPKQLDQVLENQRQMVERFTQVEARMGKVEQDVNGLQIRVVKLEAK